MADWPEDASDALHMLTLEHDMSKAVLADYVRSCFAHQPHAYVNPETGRKKHHPLGTNDRHLDRHDDVSAEGVRWKGQGCPVGIGCWNVFVSVLERVQVGFAAAALVSADC